MTPGGCERHASRVTVSSPIPRHTGRDRRDPLPTVRRPRSDRVTPARGESRGAETVSAETLRDHWSVALDAARSALRAASVCLPSEELRVRAARLDTERDSTTELLNALAGDQRQGIPYLHVALAPSEARELLGLPPDVHACVFNVDGVLIGSAALHAAAWAETFDEFISRRIERTGGHFAPFNTRLDYPAHIHGRPRLEGVSTFLASRGISLPAGAPADRPGAETVYGLANRKNQALLRLLGEHALTAHQGTRRYLELARAAALRCAVVSASANTQTMLERAGLASLIDARVDGLAIVAEHLRARPAPDILLAACRRLDLSPTETAVFEASPAGIEAARAGNFAYIIGVDRTADRMALADSGADAVVSGLGEMLDHRFAA
jgi:HAD superfamily hydrolase (TIGR01509 family)